MSFLNDIARRELQTTGLALFAELLLSSKRLAGLSLLVLEDEFLIAMDVEELCRDEGASNVVICKNVGEATARGTDYDAAIIDVMLGGESTFEFARELDRRGVPFVFASGYSDRRDINDMFPDVAIVGKPYTGDDLMDALDDAIRMKRSA